MADVTMDIASNGSLETAERDALVISAGASGLSRLPCLRDRLGLSVKALKAGGGTWYWSRDPGAWCDSESHVYGYTFSPELMHKWEWSACSPGQPAILRDLHSGTWHTPAQRTAQGRRRRRQTALSTDSHATPCWGRPALLGPDRAGGWGRTACRGADSNAMSAEETDTKALVMLEGVPVAGV